MMNNQTPVKSKSVNFINERQIKSFDVDDLSNNLLKRLQNNIKDHLQDNEYSYDKSKIHMYKIETHTA